MKSSSPLFYDTAHKVPMSIVCEMMKNFDKTINTKQNPSLEEIREAFKLDLLVISGNPDTETLFKVWGGIMEEWIGIMEKVDRIEFGEKDTPNHIIKRATERQEPGNTTVNEPSKAAGAYKRLLKAYSEFEGRELKVETTSLAEFEKLLIKYKDR